LSSTIINIPKKICLKEYYEQLEELPTTSFNKKEGDDDDLFELSAVCEYLDKSKKNSGPFIGKFYKIEYEKIKFF
jgi:hypothetical protein